MGYMGLGMNSAVYTRKPKKAFKKWGKHVVHFPETVPLEQQIITEERKAAIRKMEKTERRKSLAKRIATYAMVLLGIAAVAWWNLK